LLKIGIVLVEMTQMAFGPTRMIKIGFDSFYSKNKFFFTQYAIYFGQGFNKLDKLVKSPKIVTTKIQFL
jgi:hypothetical protein